MSNTAISIDLLNKVQGGPELIAWFDGQTPSFHDAEIIEAAFDRRNSSGRIKIHGFRITPDLNEKGHYKSEKHIIITFQFEAIAGLELTDFNHQNVIDGLQLTRQPNGNFLLEMEPCYGLFGKIEAANLKIELEPGAPEGIYSP